MSEVIATAGRVSLLASARRVTREDLLSSSMTGQEQVVASLMSLWAGTLTRFGTSVREPDARAAYSHAERKAYDDLIECIDEYGMAASRWDPRVMVHSDPEPVLAAEREAVVKGKARNER